MALRFLAFLGNVDGALALVGINSAFRKITHAERRVCYIVYVLAGPFSSPICDGRFGIPAGGNV